MSVVNESQSVHQFPPPQPSIPSGRYLRNISQEEEQASLTYRYGRMCACLWYVAGAALISGALLMSAIVLAARNQGDDRGMAFLLLLLGALFAFVSREGAMEVLECKR